jgi:SAM-dependent methyltransferase
VDIVLNRACKGLKLDKNRQLQYYKRVYNNAVYDKYITSATNREVSNQEIHLLKILFKVLFKEPKVIQRQMLNIPSGNGRLHSLFKKFFMRIDCVDGCEGAISKVAEQKTQPDFRKCIGLFKVDYLQDFKFTFKSKYDLIWCNYGFSFLEDSDARKFLQRASDNLKEDGYLVIKEVLLDGGQTENLRVKD